MRESLSRPDGKTKGFPSGDVEREPPLTGLAGSLRLPSLLFRMLSTLTLAHQQQSAASLDAGGSGVHLAGMRAACQQHRA